MSETKTVIAQTDELQNGEMTMIFTDSGLEVLLMRIEDRYYATDAYCPHHDAPLETGILSGKKVMCPWHHAMFDVETGAVSEPPASHGLKSYKLDIRGKDIILLEDESGDEKEKKADATLKQMEDERTFLIIGGGAAGNAAARKLRELGFEGHIVMITADDQPPYDRTGLSKDFLKGSVDAASLTLNPQDFYKTHRIEVIVGQRVKSLDSHKRVVHLENKISLFYDRLLVATGGKPRKLNIPGIELGRIFTLRTLQDARNIVQAAEKAEHVAVVGASFIGLETAESLNHSNRTIHVIAPESIPFAKILGKEVGTLIRKKMEDSGIVFHLGTTVSAFKGGKNLEKIILENGDTIDADLAVLGIGVEPETGFMPESVKVADQGLLTDDYLQVENDIYAAGDIATFLYRKTDDMVRIEHWRVAEQLGIIAARNMLDMKTKIDIIPFFWTDLAGLAIRYSGYGNGWDDIIIQGNLSKENFIVYYTRQEQVTAVLGVNRDEQIAVIEELFKHDTMPSKKELQSKNWTRKDLTALL